MVRLRLFRVSIMVSVVVRKYSKSRKYDTLTFYSHRAAHHYGLQLKDTVYMRPDFCR